MLSQANEKFGSYITHFVRVILSTTTQDSKSNKKLSYR